MNCFHGAALDTEPVTDTKFGVRTRPVVGWYQTLSVPQLVIRLEKYATALATVTDGVGSFLLVAQSMNQPFFSSLAENLVGFLTGEFTPHIIFYNVMSQPIKMETNLSGMLASG